jgi:hypothetical protein
MDVYRYINNTEKDIISGAYLVPALDQLMFTESQPVLEALVGKTLVGIKNGVVTDIAPVEDKPVVVSKPVVEKPVEVKSM